MALVREYPPVDVTAITLRGKGRQPMADTEDEGSNAKTKLLEEVAAQMDAIEGDLGEDFEIVSAITVVVVNGNGEGGGVRVRHIDITPLEGIGLLSVAQDVLKSEAFGELGEP
jgi:hypothetical protein